MVSNFDHFCDRRHFDVDESVEANKISANMLTQLRGQKWRHTRNVLSPAFTSGKLKAMLPLLFKVGDELSDYIGSLAKKKTEFNAKDIMTKYTVDCIASAGFGIDGKAFKDPNNALMKMALKINGSSTSIKGKLHLMMWVTFPWLARKLQISFRNEEAVLFFANIMKNSIKMRKDGKARRNDLIDLIKDASRLKSEADVRDEPQFEKDAAMLGRDESVEEMSKEEFELLMVANGLIMFVAGFETSSTALSVCLGFLCKEKEIQRKLVREVREAIEKNNGDCLNYGQIQGLALLDMVVMETLRFYFSGITERECVKPYKLPETDFVVPKGMIVQIPAMAIHRDSRYYPDPDHFNPEVNFSVENKSKRSPYAFLTFGQGPRNCIGMRFALLMVKIALVKILSEYVVVEGPSMPQEIVMDPKSRGGYPKGGIWCIFKKE